MTDSASQEGLLVFRYVDHSLPSVNSRLAVAMNATLLEIDGNHSLDICAPGELDRLLNAIAGFVTQAAAR